MPTTMKKSKKKDSDLITQTALLEREGWTKTAINNFDLIPAKTSINPVFKCAAEVKLYSIKEIRKIEKTKAFKDWKLKCLKRKEAAAKAVATKKANLAKQIRHIKIYVEKEKNVLDNAIESYNDFQLYKEYGECGVSRFASRNSNPEFLDRITVNYIRHDLTSYEEDLERLFGKTGKEFGYMLLNQKIYKKIASAYPEYSEECERQFSAKFDASLYEDLI